MTDNEIIKALECLCGVGDSCAECAYHKKYRFAECRKQVAKDALDLITRQQAEIERLTKETMNMSVTIETCQSEAIKEFAERLKKRQVRICDCFEGVSIIDIDNLVKEMVGED